MPDCNTDSIVQLPYAISNKVITKGGAGVIMNEFIEETESKKQEIIELKDEDGVMIKKSNSYVKSFNNTSC